MRAGHALLPAAVALGSILAAARAEAQTAQIPADSWRQTDRGTRYDEDGSSQYFAFELRFGGYYPQVDQEPALGGATPYKSIIKDGGPQFYIGLELDFLPLRIPYVGTFGPGIGWGYTRASKKAKFSAEAGPDRAGTESGDTTGLTIMPMYGVAVLRVDEFMRRWGIPVVPFAKLGFGLGTWTANTNAGTETYGSGDKAIKGSGISYGLHYGLGGAISLNFLDPAAARRLDQNTGVNHVYLMGEWMNNTAIGRMSKGMYIGSSSWVVGLAVDM